MVTYFTQQENDKYYVFRLDRVVNELVREITLQLYRIGDLVV